MAQDLGLRLLRKECQGASGLENGALYLVQRAESLLVGGFQDLHTRDRLVAEPFLPDLPALDQDHLFPFDETAHLLVSEQEADDEVIEDEQGRTADEAAGHGLVLSDDGVLHGVRQQEKDHEVERIELRQLALPRQTQTHDEKEVDDDRPGHLLGERQTHAEHVIENLRVHASSPVRTAPGPAGESRRPGHREACGCVCACPHR